LLEGHDEGLSNSLPKFPFNRDNGFRWAAVLRRTGDETKTGSPSSGITVAWNQNTYDCGIGAGGSIPNEILINRVFKLDRPGKYIIRVSRREPFVKDEKGEPPVIWSNPITITITG
jgi:hypothetical protein